MSAIVDAFDLLVVGSGLAGEIAALEAARRGQRVAVLSKGQPFRSHSAVAAAGINLSLHDADSWREHAKDLWNDGHFLADWAPIERLTQDGPPLVLREFGDLLDRGADGEIVFYQFGGTHRAARAGRNTGLRFVRRLYDRMIEAGVRHLPDRVVLSLVVEDDRCVGLVALDVVSGRLEAYTAGAVILCSGGFGHVFQHTAHSSTMTGDGHALALRAGAELEDMEFVRFAEAVVHGAATVITEMPGRKGMHLYNKDGERFVGRYDSLLEKAEPFYLKRYMQLELDAGRGVEGNHFVADFTHLGESHVARELPRSRRVVLLATGLDLARDRIPVVPGVFMTIGGIATDVDGRTRVGGLFAAGECACTGVHGADWRAGNTVLAALVFGHRAGVAAAEDVRHPNDARPAIERALAETSAKIASIAARPGDDPGHLLVGELRRTMAWDVGVARDRPRLERALARIRDLRRRYAEAIVWDPSPSFNEPLVAFLELESMLTVAEAVTIAALARDESRGCHWRTDHPERDDARWLRHSFVWRDGEGALALRHAATAPGANVPAEKVIIR